MPEPRYYYLCGSCGLDLPRGLNFEYAFVTCTECGTAHLICLNHENQFSVDKKTRLPVFLSRFSFKSQKEFRELTPELLAEYLHSQSQRAMKNLKGPVERRLFPRSSPLRINLLPKPPSGLARLGKALRPLEPLAFVFAPLLLPVFLYFWIQDKLTEARTKQVESSEPPEPIIPDPVIKVGGSWLEFAGWLTDQPSRWTLLTDKLPLPYNRQWYYLDHQWAYVGAEVHFPFSQDLYADLSCGSCHKTGTLAFNLQGLSCPHCTNSALEEMEEQVPVRGENKSFIIAKDHILQSHEYSYTSLIKDKTRRKQEKQIVRSSHFGAVGFGDARFPFEREDIFADIMLRVLHNMDRNYKEKITGIRANKLIKTPHGVYLNWSSDNGIELWLQTDGDNIVGCNPHFAGHSSVKVKITELVPSQKYPLNGRLHGWLSSEEIQSESDQYPVVFDMPNFRVVEPALLQSQTITVQIAAFAHTLNLYPNVEEYEAPQVQEPPIPYGLFSILPNATVSFTGTILEMEWVKNPLTQVYFYWFLVMTPGGIFDVVADPELVTEMPQRGGILSGTFWLSGKVLLATGDAGNENTPV